MKKKTRGIVLWGISFLVLGMLWTTTIYVRCGTLLGWWQKPAAPSSVVVQQEEPESPETIIRRFRSPHAKEYHIVFFWVLVFFELACGVAFFVCGVALIRRYLFARMAILCTLYLDIFFKMLAAWYMHYCAFPLEYLTENRNILHAYYFPDRSFWSEFSGYLSGLKMFSIDLSAGALQLGGVIYMVLYIAGVFACFYYFTSNDVVKQFVKQKRKNKRTKRGPGGIGIDIEGFVKRFFLLVASLLLSGCVIVSETTKPTTEVLKGHKLLSLRQVQNGMTPKEVQVVVGSQVVVGYTLNEKTGQYKPITQKNPYRSEMVTKGSKTYQVHYYFAVIKQADGKITEDELVPLVFQDGQLVGQGWAFFRKKIGTTK